MEYRKAIEDYILLKDPKCTKHLEGLSNSREPSYYIRRPTPKGVYIARIDKCQVRLYIPHHSQTYAISTNKTFPIWANDYSTAIKTIPIEDPNLFEEIDKWLEKIQNIT